MPYDKDGKYYRKPVVPEKTGASLDQELVTINKVAWALTILLFAGIVGGCTAIFNNVRKANNKPREFDSIYARVYCDDLIKDKLKDPSSYKFYSVKILEQTGSYNQYGSATLEFGAKNSFGGMVRRVAICDKYNEFGKDYLRVNILP